MGDQQKKAIDTQIIQAETEIGTVSLRPRVFRFCEEYLNNGYNVRQATIAAGYKGNSTRVNGYQLLKKPEVRAYIEMRLRELNEVTKVTFDWKLQKLRQTARKCMPDETPHDIVPLKSTNPAAAVSAIAEMNKMTGAYAPIKSVTVNINSDQDLGVTKKLADMLLEQKECDY